MTFARQSLGSLATLLFGLAVAIVLPRILGAEARGEYQLAVKVAALVLAVAQWGIPEVLLQMTADRRHSRARWSGPRWPSACSAPRAWPDPDRLRAARRRQPAARCRPIAARARPRRQLRRDPGVTGAAFHPARRSHRPLQRARRRPNAAVSVPGADRRCGASARGAGADAGLAHRRGGAGSRGARLPDARADPRHRLADRRAGRTRTSLVRARRFRWVCWRCSSAAKAAPLS